MNTTTRTTTLSPRTAPPTDVEWANYCRWAIPPLGSRRHYWVAREAQAVFTARTGRGDPFPALCDYETANAAIPADYPL
jgi:hypothetical protein